MGDDGLAFRKGDSLVVAMAKMMQRHMNTEERAAMIALRDAWEKDILLANMSKAELDVAEAQWEQQTAPIKKRRDEAIAFAAAKAETDCRQEITEARQENQKRIDELTKMVAEYQRRAKYWNEELKNMEGFHPFRKDKVIEQMAWSNYHADNSYKQIEQAPQQLEKREKAIHGKYAKKVEEAVAEVEKIYPIPENPKDRRARINAFMIGYKTGAWKSHTETESRAVIREYIPTLLSAHGPATIKKMTAIMDRFFREVVGEAVPMQKEKLAYCIKDTIKQDYSGVIYEYETYGNYQYSLK